MVSTPDFVTVIFFTSPSCMSAKEAKGKELQVVANVVVVVVVVLVVDIEIDLEARELMEERRTSVVVSRRRMV